MAFDDLTLHHTPAPATPPPPPKRPSSPTRWIVVAAICVVSAALVSLWWMGRAQPEPVAAPAAAHDIAMAGSRPQRQPIDLPGLDASDVFIRELVSALSRHPLLAQLLATKDLVRNAVLTIEQVGEGKTPALPLATLRPTDRLAIVGTETGRIDPRTYARWDNTLGALTSVRPNDAAQLYVNIKPLFDEAYQGLGHPGGNFDASIVRAIQTLAETPEPAGDPTLIRRPGYYEHADDALRGLKPVQKQLLLFGPDNRHRLMDWLKQLAAALDLKI